MFVGTVVGTGPRKPADPEFYFGAFLRLMRSR